MYAFFLLLSNDDIASAETACTSSKACLESFLQVVACACYNRCGFGYLLFQYAMQTNYVAGVESLKTAAKELAIKYQHYSSGVVRLEVSVKHFTSIDCISHCQQHSCLTTAAETETPLGSYHVEGAGGQLD